MDHGPLIRQLQGEAKVPLTFEAGWGNLGGGNEAATRSRFGRTCILQGTVTKSGTPAAGNTITILPEEYWPDGEMLFPVVSGGTTGFGSIVIRTDGQVDWVTGSTTETDFTSLSGVVYVV